jgi:hypothetical protein
MRTWLSLAIDSLAITMEESVSMGVGIKMPKYSAEPKAIVKTIMKASSKNTSILSIKEKHWATWYIPIFF